MAKCDLKIELDDPDRVYWGGSTIEGVVRVRCDADVNCKGLSVKSVWRTHGKGNVDSGEVKSETLFAGTWTAGQDFEYRFQLPIADWPPTYHGTFLNVDHYIDARASVPWSFDPKASVPFTVRPRVSAEDAEPTRAAAEANGMAKYVIGAVLLVILGVAVAIMAMAGPFLACFFAPFALIAGGIWFVRSFLPRYLLGEVQVDFSPENVIAGESASGQLIVRPKKAVSINAVTLTLQAREQCVSGSGSNRTTHKHVLFENTHVLQESTTLAAGGEHTFPFSVNLPSNAPCSIDLRDNELIWSSTLRIDIPRWPDWKQEYPINVAPAVNRESAEGPPPAAISTAAEMSDSPSPSELTFDETARHIASVRNDRLQLETLVEAVSGLTFELAAEIERRLLYSGDDDPHVYPDGYAVWAHYLDPPLPLVLYVPHDLADEFEQIGSGQWQGRGTIVGWDTLHQRLQVKLESR